MTLPYYASPEQLMRDRSEYARKGISRGRSVAVLTYADGVLFIAENPSSTLHKVGELYDLNAAERHCLSFLVRSGPQTASETSFCSAHVASAGTSSGSSGSDVASCCVPPLPRVMKNSACGASARSLRRRACSRPPLPTIRIFMDGVAW